MSTRKCLWSACAFWSEVEGTYRAYVNEEWVRNTTLRLYKYTSRLQPALEAFEAHPQALKMRKRGYSFRWASVYASSIARTASLHLTLLPNSDILSWCGIFWSSRNTRESAQAETHWKELYGAAISFPLQELTDIAHASGGIWNRTTVLLRRLNTTTWIWRFDVSARVNAIPLYFLQLPEILLLGALRCIALHRRHSLHILVENVEHFH